MKPQISLDLCSYIASPEGVLFASEKKEEEIFIRRDTVKVIDLYDREISMYTECATIILYCSPTTKVRDLFSALMKYFGPSPSRII